MRAIKKTGYGGTIAKGSGGLGQIGCCCYECCDNAEDMILEIWGVVPCCGRNTAAGSILVDDDSGIGGYYLLTNSALNTWVSIVANAVSYTYWSNDDCTGTPEARTADLEIYYECRFGCAEKLYARFNDPDQGWMYLYYWDDGGLLCSGLVADENVCGNAGVAAAGGTAHVSCYDGGSLPGPYCACESHFPLAIVFSGLTACGGCLESGGFWWTIVGGIPDGLYDLVYDAGSDSWKLTITDGISLTRWSDAACTLDETAVLCDLTIEVLCNLTQFRAYASGACGAEFDFFYKTAGIKDVALPNDYVVGDCGNAGSFSTKVGAYDGTATVSCTSPAGN